MFPHRELSNTGISAFRIVIYAMLPSKFVFHISYMKCCYLVLQIVPVHSRWTCTGSSYPCTGPTTHANLYKGTTRIPSLGAVRVPLMRSSKFKLCCVLETNTKKSRYSGRLYVLLLRHNIVFRRRSFSNQKSDLAAGFSRYLCEIRSSCPSKSTFPLLLDLY